MRFLLHNRISCWSSPPVQSSRSIQQSTVLLVLGLGSSFEHSVKAQKLAQLCRRLPSTQFVALDLSGHGRSAGSLETATVSDWKRDCLHVLDSVVAKDSRVVMVGASMGLHLSLLTACCRPGRIEAIVGVGGAVNPARRWAAQHLSCTETPSGHCFHLPSPYAPGGFYRLSSALLDSNNPDNHISTDAPVFCTLEALHGTADSVVPVSEALALLDLQHPSFINVNIVKGGDHRLSRPADVDLLLHCVGSKIRQLPDDRKL